jgi:type IV secretory pathway VirB10-like protein
MRLSILLFLCVFGAGAVDATKVYKWVDKDGNIHYSEQKPANQQADTLRIKENKPTPLPEEKEQAMSASEADSNEATDDQDSQQRAEAQKSLAAADQVNKQKLCQQAKANRDALNASVRVSRIDPETGEQVRMSDDERVNALKKAMQAIKDYCQ